MQIDWYLAEMAVYVRKRKGKQHCGAQKGSYTLRHAEHRALGRFTEYHNWRLALQSITECDRV